MNERGCTLDDVREALAYISPEARDTWIMVLHAVKEKFGDDGRDLCDSWSQDGSSYNEKDFRTVWRGIKSTRGIGIGPVFKAAMASGFKFAPRSEEDRLRLERDAAARRQVREREEAEERARLAKVQAAVAIISRALWADHLTQDGESDYLAAKGVGAFGVRFGRSSVIAWVRLDDGRHGLITGTAAIGKFYEEHRQYDRETNPAPYSFRHIKPGTLAVPLVDGDGVLWSLQLIYPTGKKSFFRDSRKQGCFHLLGDPPAPTYQGRLWIAEGYSSAASVHMATGEPTVMAVDAGNLLPVAQTLRATYPGAALVFAADNDMETDGNPGVTKAKEAAAAVGGRVWVPLWPQQVAA